MENKKVSKICVSNVYKSFDLESKKNDRALAKLISLFSGKASNEKFEVLKNISFEANIGENIGLIGKNGSGKSTLLRLLAGIYQVKQGQLNITGNVLYLNGFGFGLKDRLTMRDNIFLSGLLMGLSKKEIQYKFNDIVKFSELEDYIDTKIHQFSSGMINRLRFSITVNLLQEKSVDILLLDEVFGSGSDASFENKAIIKMEELIRGGTIVVLVSHNLNIIRKYCNRVILLEKGSIIKQGESNEVVDFYLNSIVNTKK